MAAGVLATAGGSGGRGCRLPLPGQGATGGVATADSHAGARGCYG